MLCTSANLLTSRSHALGSSAIRQALISALVFLAAVFIPPTHASSQIHPQHSDARPEFEVASIKPNLSGCCSSSKWSADQVSFSNQTLMHLVLWAYKLEPNQLVGPDWMNSERFDITAKYPPNTMFDDRLLMLQTLLQARFDLVVHRDMKEMQAYELLVATTGFKLKPSGPGEPVTVGGTESGIRKLQARKIPMGELAYILSDSLHETVIDKTGLNGRLRLPAILGRRRSQQQRVREH